MCDSRTEEAKNTDRGAVDLREKYSPHSGDTMLRETEKVREREREGEVGGVGSRAAQKNAGEKDEKRRRKREGVVRLQLGRIPRRMSLTDFTELLVS